MPLRLSHTQVSKYLECPRKWKYYYKDKIRPDGIGSALFFGISLDEAFNRLLLEKKKYFKNDEHFDFYLSPEEIFKFSMNPFMKNENCEYFKSDLDLSLLTPTDIKDINEYADELGFDEYFKIPDIIKYTYDMKFSVDIDTKKIFNYINWLSLYRKGLILIQSYKTNIMPKIHEVIEIQREVRLENEETKDSYIGKIDFIATFKDEPNVEYICDNKSTSKPFKVDDVESHSQLASYSEAENNRNVAIVYVEKKLRKKTPITRQDIVKTQMPENTIEKTFHNIEITIDGIKKKDYNKIVDNKKEAFRSCFFYGRQCEYFDLCWESGGKKNDQKDR